MEVFILNIKCVGKIPYVILNEKKKKKGDQAFPKIQ